MGDCTGLTPVSLYVARIVSMVNRYGERSVLVCLPVCMKFEAVIWYDSLWPKIQRKMDRSPNEWIVQLRRQFSKDPEEAWIQMEECKFSFDEEQYLSLRGYVTNKTLLLKEAGIEDDERVVTLLWRGLDPIVRNALSIDRGNNLANFVRHLYKLESAARGEYERLKGMIKAGKSNKGHQNQNAQQQQQQQQKPYQSPFMPS